MVIHLGSGYYTLVSDGTKFRYMVDGEEYNCSRNQFKNVLAYWNNVFYEPVSVSDYTAVFNIEGTEWIVSPATYTGELGILEIE